MGTLSHMSTHVYFHSSVHVASSQRGHVSLFSPLLGQPSRHSKTSCPDHWCHWAVRVSLIASNLLWYARPWLTDTILTDGILLILTSTSVNRHVKSQAINKIERTTICFMMCRLTQPPTALQMWWLPCHYCVIITTKANSALLSPSLPLNIIKNPTEIEQEEDIVSSLSLSLSLSLLGFPFIPKVWLGLQRVCPNNLSKHLCVGKQKA